MFFKLLKNFLLMNCGSIRVQSYWKFCKSRAMLKIDDSDIAGSTRRMDFWKKLY